MTAGKRSGNRPQVTPEAMNAATRTLAPSTLDGAPAFIGMCDETFRPTYLNPAGRSMVGFPEHMNLTSVAIRDFFVSEHRPVVATIGLPTMAREGRWEQDLRFRHWQEPAREIVVACSIFGLYDERKNFLAGVTITQEIKSRAKADRAVRDSRAMVDAVLEQLPLEVGIFDATGRLLHSNEGWRRRGMVSLPARPHTSPQRWKRFTRGDELLASEDLGARALHGKPYQSEEQLPTGPGQSRHWYRVNAAPLVTKDDAPAGAVVVMQDIDELRNAGAKLAQSTARLKVAVDLAEAGTFLFDPATGALECDERLRQLWGFGTSEPIDWQKLQDAIHPADAARVGAAVGSCMSAAHAQSFRMEYRVISRDSGKVRRIDCACRSTFEDRRLAWLVGACREVDPTTAPRVLRSAQPV